MSPRGEASATGLPPPASSIPFQSEGQGASPGASDAGVDAAPSMQTRAGAAGAGDDAGAFGGLSNVEFLERLLEEMAGSSLGPGIRRAAAGASPEEDQFVASLQLRLAQEYVALGAKMDKAEGLAFSAWQFFSKANSKEDLAGAVALHVLGSCKARKGDSAGAMKVLQRALQAARACRASTLASSKPRGKKAQRHKGQERGRGAPLQPDGLGGLKDLLLEEAGRRPDPSPLQGEHARSAATALEFSCHMMMGELLEGQGELEQALKMYNAAVNTAEGDPGLSGAPARRDAYYNLANVLVQLGDFEGALECAQLAPLAVRSPVQPPPSDGEAGQDSLDAWGAEHAAEVSRTVRDKRLLASVHVGLGDIQVAAEHMRGLRPLMAELGASPLELAAVDVAAAEVMLCGPTDDDLSDMEEVEVEEDGAQAEDLAAAKPPATVHARPQAEASGRAGSQEVEAGSTAPRKLTAREIVQLQEEALGLLTSAARVQEGALGKLHPLLAPTRVAAAEACLQLGMEDQALEFCLSAVEVFEALERAEGEAVENGPELMAQTASVLTNLGRMTDALRLLGKAEALLLQEPGRAGDALGMIMDHASLLLSLDDAPAVCDLFSKAEEDYREVLSGNPMLCADFLHLKGCAHAENGSTGQAVDALREARNLAGKEDSGDLLLKINVSLVAALAKADQFEEAVEVQKALLNGLKGQALGDLSILEAETEKLRELEAYLKPQVHAV